MKILFHEKAVEAKEVGVIKHSKSDVPPQIKDPIWEEASLFGVELEPHLPIDCSQTVSSRGGSSEKPELLPTPKILDWGPVIEPEHRTPAPHRPHQRIPGADTRHEMPRLKRNCDGAFEECDRDGRTVIRDEHTCKDPELLKELRRLSRRRTRKFSEQDEEALHLIPIDPYSPSSDADVSSKRRSINRAPKPMLARAVSMLARRDYSVKELKVKLALKLTADETSRDIDLAINRLLEMGLLSDERFARTRARIRSERNGDAAIRRELRSLGLERELIDSAMSEIEDPEEMRCWRLWMRRFGELPEDRRERERQIRYLAYRGFKMDIILKVIRGEVENDAF